MTQYEKRVVEGAFEEVLERVREQLEEDFRILYDVDVGERLEGPFDTDDHPRCRIIGAGDPRLAGKDPDDGVAIEVLLSGRLVVCESDEDLVLVGAVDPHTADPEDDPEAKTSAEQVRVRLARVLRSVAMETDVVPE